MASGWTEEGKKAVLGWSFRGETIPTNYYMRLITSAVAPTVEDTTVAGIMITRGLR